jgi:hypothetical protein
MQNYFDCLPGGRTFAFWDDETRYIRVYHVAGGHPRAADDNPGTEALPWKTIGRAAQVLEPGEKVVVHAGIYREHVAPGRGGEWPARMIAYEAAPGERVVIKGSDVWQPDWRLDDNVPVAEGQVWQADLPTERFAGYNPFLANNTCRACGTYDMDWSKQERQLFLLRRGMVFLDGEPLRQVYSRQDMLGALNTFWVEEPGTHLHLHLPEGGVGAGHTFEITVREQVFAPRLPHLAYLRVSGFILEHAADGIPFPQRALLSTNWGHHWIVEGCTIRHANACGIDLGVAGSQWHPHGNYPEGGHIIRRNHISRCGVCGIAAVDNSDDVLVEDNVVEHIGGRISCRIMEVAGLKFHFCRRVLIRRNVFRHITQGDGVWLDVDAQHCRITANRFADISALKGAIHMECCFHAPNLIDHNVISDIRRAGLNDNPPEDPWSGGGGIFADCNDDLTIAHNLFHRVETYAVELSVLQSGRLIGDRAGACRNNRVLNNVFAACPKWMLFGRRESNVSDGNLFDADPSPRGSGLNDRALPQGATLCVKTPEPSLMLNLSMWRDVTGQDAHSAVTAVAVEPAAGSGCLRSQADTAGVIPQPVLPQLPVLQQPGPAAPPCARAADDTGAAHATRTGGRCADGN